MGRGAKAELPPKELISLYGDLIKDSYSIVSNANSGVHAKVFYDLLAITGLSKHQLAEDLFGLSSKTFSRYKADDKHLSPRNSEMALKLISLYQKGLELFGSVDSFNRWMNKAAFGLGDQIPYNLVNTMTGMELVLEELIRIEYGDLA